MVQELKLSLEEIKLKILEIFNEVLGDTEEEIEIDAFIDDLIIDFGQGDSENEMLAAKWEIIIKTESCFSIEVEDDEFEKLLTFKNLIELVDKKRTGED